MTTLLQPRRLEPWKILLPMAVLLTLAGWRFWRSAPSPSSPTLYSLHFAGATMGTTYSIRIPVPKGYPPEEARKLESAIKVELERINAAMSAYRPDSEISRFNRAPPGEFVLLSEDSAAVIGFALHLARASGGAFDPSIAPLLRLWGFGPGAPTTPHHPTEEEWNRARAQTGVEHLELSGRQLVKKKEGLSLDLNAVAKGFGVDAVARVLREQGLDRFMVEIGGEVVVAGLNARGQRWRIGVDRPDPKSIPGQSLIRVLEVTDLAIATSGDYRNLRHDETGHVVSHLFDPRLGRPMTRDRSSVTVLARDAMTADGLATALYVMGAEEGLPWLKRTFPDCDALFAELQPDGSVTVRSSARFDSRTRNPETRP